MLFVCTGNICRSPIAERLFRARIDATAPVVVASAGTAGLDGYPMDAPSALALRELGGNPDGHVARRLTPAMVARADLILAATTQHRSVIVQSDPPAFRRTFTLREFARLSATLGLGARPVATDALVMRVEEVAHRRGLADPAAPGADDIADPFGAPLKAARQCAEQISSALDAVIGSLGLRWAAAPSVR